MGGLSCPVETVLFFMLWKLACNRLLRVDALRSVLLYTVAHWLVCCVENRSILCISLGFREAGHYLNPTHTVKGSHSIYIHVLVDDCSRSLV